jgi:hypothetical protein
LLHQEHVQQQLRKEVRQEDVQQLKRAEVRHHLFAVADRTLGLLSRGMRVSSVARYACVFCREVCVCLLSRGMRVSSVARYASVYIHIIY